jgi:predicted O-methyltransferase YrrM
MQTLQVILLMALLVGVIYCIKSLRALHQKISSRSDRNTREIAASTKEIKAALLQSYRQSEAFSQLVNLLKFSAPIPPTRSWAASPDLLLTIADLVLTHKPRLVVELGSGVSTLIVAKSGAKKTISMDNSEEFAGKTRALLKSHGVRGVEIRVAELQPHESGVDWYETSKFSDLKRIDLLIVDGPPGSKDPRARKPAFSELIDRLSPRAVIVIDDVNRDGERELAEAFAEALPSHILTIYPHEKGTAVISPR